MSDGRRDDTSDERPDPGRSPPAGEQGPRPSREASLEPTRAAAEGDDASARGDATEETADSASTEAYLTAASDEPPPVEAESRGATAGTESEAEPASTEGGPRASREASLEPRGPASDAGARGDRGQPRGGGAAQGGRGAARRGRPGRLLGAIALVVAVAAAAGAGWLYQRLQAVERELASVAQARSAALEPLARRAELQALRESMRSRLAERIEGVEQARSEALAALEADLRERTDTLAQGVAEVRELAARDQVGWRLAEIRYLLAVAQRRLAIARDVRAAIAALEGADRAIAELGSVRLLPLRQRIVEDLAALRGVESADVEGAALRLQNLLARVDGLPSTGGPDTDGTRGEAGWWARLGERLDDYVSIRRRPDGGVARPPRGADLGVHDRLVLALEHAREAALRRDPERYRAALDRAEAALGDGFAGGASATRRFRAALADLRARPVVAELPDLTPTIELAERLSARIESTPKAADAPVPRAAPGEGDAARPGDEPLGEDAASGGR